MTQARLPELDGLRGLAAVLVLSFHFSPYAGPLTWLRPMADVGWIGLDLFFVLSGFLITGILLRTVGQPGYFAGFLLRRTLRIFPLYYACLAIFLGVLYLHPDRTGWDRLLQWGSPVWFVAYAGNIHAVLINEYPPLDPFIPLWSLHVEEQFYLLVPLLVAVCRPAILQRVLIGAVAASLVSRILLTVLAPDHVLATWWLISSRMDGLGLGCLLAISVHRGTLRLSARQCAGLAAAFGGACGAVFVMRSTVEIEDPVVRAVGFTLVGLMFVCLLAAVLGRLGSRATAPLRWQPLVYAGQISYGLYLLHLPAALAARSLLQPLVAMEPHGSLNFVVSMGASFVAASLSWRFFESRILLLRDRLRPTGPVTPHVAFAASTGER